jgi:hypothetical protein
VDIWLTQFGLYGYVLIATGLLATSALFAVVVMPVLGELRSPATKWIMLSSTIFRSMVSRIRRGRARKLSGQAAGAASLTQSSKKAE